MWNVFSVKIIYYIFVNSAQISVGTYVHYNEMLYCILQGNSG